MIFKQLKISNNKIQLK